MSAEQSPSEVAETVATEAAVAQAASRELRVPLESVSVVRLAGDASTRGFFRVAYPGGSAVAVRYPSPFGMDFGPRERFERWCAESPDGRLTFANDPLCHVELTALLARCGVPVPAMIAIGDREGLLFVEDAGDDLLQTWARLADPSDVEAAYERAVDIVAVFRGATEAVVAENAVAASLAFDADKLGWELEFFRANCFERYLDAPLDAELYAGVRADCRALAAALAARPRVLCHRDYHARNIIVRPGLPVRDALAIIDFQDARMGPVTYDLVSLVEDPYASLDGLLKHRLKERFAERLRAEGAWPGEEAFREEYDLMAAQRLLKAVGTYTHQAAVRGNREYVPYIAPAVAEAAAALDRLGRFDALRRAVERIGARGERE